MCCYYIIPSERKIAAYTRSLTYYVIKGKYIIIPYPLPRIMKFVIIGVRYIIIGFEFQFRGIMY